MQAPGKMKQFVKSVAASLAMSTLLTAVTIAPASGATRGSASERPAPTASAAAPEMAMMTAEAVQRLSEMGYWPVNSTDRMSERMRWAALAFQRVEGRKQTGMLDRTEAEALFTASSPAPKETGYRHVEVDIKRQVLFIVEADNTISRIVPVSTGSGKTYTIEGRTERAVTPRGRFTVYNKISGYRKAPLGMIYYPNYFNKGVAIHGSASIPNFPASHGCVRVPMITAKELSDLIPMGTTVLVYDDATPTTSNPSLAAAR